MTRDANDILIEQGPEGIQAILDKPGEPMPPPMPGDDEKPGMHSADDEKEPTDDEKWDRTVSYTHLTLPTSDLV